MNKQRIAVVGAGISGLATAWLLSRQYQVTLFEANNYLGGHTNTVDVQLEGKLHPVDTGFIVFNEKTYPNLLALFALLDIESIETEMSFAVSLKYPDIEWSGSSLATVFGQKRNLVRLPFWGMLREILRFNRESVAWLSTQSDSDYQPRSLRDFLTAGHYSAAFSEWYLLPMAAAIWSCPLGQMLDMPLATFVSFCQNHGLLQIFNRPLWRTVKGGGREYVKKLAAQLDDVRLACSVYAVSRETIGWRVNHAAGSEHFDQVVLACHSDQSLNILGASASDAQREVLTAIRYQANRAILHHDRALLPRNSKLWSAWNYTASSSTSSEQPVAVSYLMNRLQLLPFETPVVVTLNPTVAPDPAKVIAEFNYAHPIFDGVAIAAQQGLAEIQGERGIWLAGAWGSYGFHEDGLKSALRVANGLGISAPWQDKTLPHMSKRF